MTDFYRNTLNGQLKGQYTRVHTRPLKDGNNWDTLPETVKPVRRNRGRAIFASFRKRRFGYMLKMSPVAFLTLVGAYILTKKKRLLLQERLDRGLTWAPLYLPLKSVQTPVQVCKPADPEVEVAAFLMGIGQEEIRVQAFHIADEPANKACLNYMQEHGLVPLSGNGMVALQSAEVTL